MEENATQAPAEELVTPSQPEAQPEVTKTQGAPAQVEAQDVDPTGGVEDGTVEKSNDKLAEEVRARIDHEEKVVHEKDDDGNVVGWHKEAPSEESK
jgi:hypothetical protein